jgi:general secretion pathway protein F
LAFFQYKAVTADGRVVEGTLEAADARSVTSRLRDQGQFPVTISSAGTTESGGLLSREIKLPWRRNRVARADLLVFTQELSTLVKAGLPLDRSLSVLGELTENRHLRDVVRELLREIKGGKSLSEGMSMHPHIFPKIYVNMVRAGEFGGALDKILERLQEYLERSEELRNYFVSSLIYPLVLALVGGASIIVMIGFVIPKFADIFENAGAPIPLPMKIMLAAGDVLTGYWWLILLLGIAIVQLFKRYLRTEKGRLNWDARMLKLPLLGSIFRKLEVARFSRTLGTLLRSTVPLIQAMNIVKEVIGNQAIASTMESVKSGIKKGEGLTKPIRDADIFPPFALHLLAVGEETGRLDDMLLQIAEAYDRDMRTALKRFVALFEPLLILVMGLLIGTMVVSMLYSIFSINDVPL